MFYMLLFYGMQYIGETIMIVNVEREPNRSLYYLGGILLTVLEQRKVIPIEEILLEVQQQINTKIHVDFIYYALDWLFILSLIKIKEGKVYYENKKVNSTQNTAF